MAGVSVTIEIPRSPDIVWAELERLEAHAEWMVDVASLDFEGEQRSGAGTVMKALTKVGPLRTIDIIRVVGWHPPHSIEVVHEGVVTGEGRFLLEPTGVGTRFTWAEHLELPWTLGGPVGAWVVGRVLTFVWRGNLARFAERF
jgi:carbon monoxide dehydrogenase subunit G